MERCPNCGYKASFNWPNLVRGIAFFGMFWLWARSGYQHGWVGLSALFLYVIGVFETKIRNNRDDEAAKKLGAPVAPVADEVRDRIRSETSQ
jgi:hypothetical protein